MFEEVFGLKIATLNIARKRFAWFIFLGFGAIFIFLYFQHSTYFVFLKIVAIFLGFLSLVTLGRMECPYCKASLLIVNIYSLSNFITLIPGIVFGNLKCRKCGSRIS
jgi:DNA-directed RNA polymerase subunit RPC12/RpoP